MNFFLFLLPFYHRRRRCAYSCAIGVPKKELHRSRPHRANERKSLKSVRIILRALSNLMRWFHCANNFRNFKHRLQHSILQFILSSVGSSSPFSVMSIDRAGNVRINGSIHGARLISAPDTLKWSWRFRVFLISFFVVLRFSRCLSFKGSRAPKNAIFSSRFSSCLLPFDTSLVSIGVELLRSRNFNFR